MLFSLRKGLDTAGRHLAKTRTRISNAVDAISSVFKTRYTEFISAPKPQETPKPQAPSYTHFDRYYDSMTYIRSRMEALDLRIQMAVPEQQSPARPPRPPEKYTS